MRLLTAVEEEGHSSGRSCHSQEKGEWDEPRGIRTGLGDGIEKIVKSLLQPGGEIREKGEGKCL